MLQPSVKYGFALLVIVGLAPMVEAHACTFFPSVDPTHVVAHCTPQVCVLGPHVCAPPTAQVEPGAPVRLLP